VIERTVLCSVGHITLPRRYYSCRQCKAKAIPLDQWAGLGERHVTEHARRMLTLAGMNNSFDKASATLSELSHITVSDDTIERVCQEEGIGAADWIQSAPQAAESFTQAPGQAELYTDGLMINTTTDGWREMRLSVLAKRPAGAAAEPGDWSKRLLEEPTARPAACAIAPANVVGASWTRLCKQGGVRPTDPLSFIADGARWIWDQVGKRFKNQTMQCVVDIYHVSEHLHACGKAIFGEGPAARDWGDRHRARLLELQGPRFIAELRREIEQTPEKNHRVAMTRLESYLNENRDSLWYANRLKAGLPIGSGLIEGACKNTPGARLKLNSARWRIRRAERIGALRCLDYSGQWESYWRSRAA
jgi:hypothetical protein